MKKTEKSGIEISTVYDSDKMTGFESNRPGLPVFVFQEICERWSRDLPKVWYALCFKTGGKRSSRPPQPSPHIGLGNLPQGGDSIFRIFLHPVPHGNTSLPLSPKLEKTVVSHPLFSYVNPFFPIRRAPLCQRRIHGLQLSPTLVLPGKHSHSMPQSTRFRFEFTRWSIFSILSLIYILVFFHRMAPGVLAGELMDSFRITGAAMGSLAAAYFLVYAAMQIPAGILADRLGPRATISAGNIVAGAGSLLFGLAGSFGVAYTGRFLVGLGVSVIFVNVLKSNAEWFTDRRFALMSGVTIFIGNIGSVLSAGPLAGMLAICSWRTVFIGIGVLSLILAFAGALFIRNRPEDAGFPPVNGNRHTARPSETVHWIRDLRSVLLTRHIWPCFWINLGSTGALYAFMGLWGVPFLRDSFGLSRGEAALYVTVMLVAYSAGVLFFGWLSDHIGRRKPVLIITSLLYLGTWILVLTAGWTPGPAGLLLFALLGFTGTASIVSFAIAKELTRPSLSGTATSLVNSGIYVGTVFMQPFVGWVLDLRWSGGMSGNARIYSAIDYRIALSSMVLMAVMALAFSCTAKETFGRGSGERGERRALSLT